MSIIFLYLIAIAANGQSAGTVYTTELNGTGHADTVILTRTSYGTGGVVGDGSFEVTNGTTSQVQVLLNQAGFVSGSNSFIIPSVASTIPAGSSSSGLIVGINTTPQPLGICTGTYSIPYQPTDSTIVHSFYITFIDTIVKPQIPNAPTLAVPSSGSINQPTNLTLSWSEGSGGSPGSFGLQISTTSNFNTITFLDTTIGPNSVSVVPTGLANSTTYFWRMNATNAGGTSAWSNTWSFSTIVAAPAAPSLSTPYSMSINLATSLTLSWSSGSGAAPASYSVQVSTSETFTTTVFSQSGMTASSMALSGLANGITYYWRVQAINLGGSSPWSIIWYFGTIPLPPSAPALSSPANGIIGQSSALTLSWSSASGTVASYTVQVSTSTTFTSTVFAQTGPGLTAPIKGLAYGGITYFWQANASNAGGTSWSGVWSFVTIAAPALSSPVDGALNQPIPLTLTWASTAGAASYNVLVSIGTALSGSAFYQSGLTTNSVSVSGLAWGITYAWGAWSENSAGGGSLSSVWTFTTLSVPAAPPLSSPSNNAVFTNNTPLTLSWDTVSTATSYTIQVSSTSTFISTVLSQSSLTTAATFTPAHGINYYWHVSATNAAGAGAWSSISTLRPSVSVAQSLQKTNLTNFSLKQGAIVFSLPKEEKVELSVYDLRGREVMTFSRQQAAGSYSIDLKGISLSAGQYIVNFKAGAFEKIATMMFTR